VAKFERADRSRGGKKSRKKPEGGPIDAMERRLLLKQELLDYQRRSATRRYARR